MKRWNGKSRRNSKLYEALSLLLQAREHVDSYGMLDSEGRTLVTKAIKLINESGVHLDFRKLRRRWDLEELDKVIAQLVDLDDLSR